MPMYRNPGASGGSTGGVPEAPTDGDLYARRGSDATWRTLNVVYTAPGTTAPEGMIQGFVKGQTYTQLAAAGHKLRDWTFNGTAGATVGWI